MASWSSELTHMGNDETESGFTPEEIAALEKALKETDIDELNDPQPTKPHPSEEVDRTYTEDLLCEIASKYGFDLNETRFRYWIRSGAIRFYLYNEALPNRHPSRLAEERKSLKKDLLIIERFQEHFGLETYAQREFKPSTPNPFFEEIERITLSAMKHKDADLLERDLFNLYYHHRQLDTAIAERKHEIEVSLLELKSYKGGRPANEGAYEFVAYLSDFWARDLKRPYTIDSYQGQGLTEAFLFIRDCAAPLVPISDSQIISMMRKYKEKSRYYFDNLQKPR